MNNPKIIALYLPQFHCIPENDLFWGKGFTDWISVKKAKPLYKGHNQPVIPLNNNYYDLSREETVEWQANLAKEHGIYGFGVYHYWFNNEKNLLTKPAEILRDSKCINIKYFFIWDNNNWKRSWSNIPGNSWALTEENTTERKKGTEILIPFILGEKKDWENHYKYLREHFLSPNYEKWNNKPLFSIIYPSKEIKRMCDYWNELAIKDGFEGICFIYKQTQSIHLNKLDYRYCYQPHWAGWERHSFIKRVRNKIYRIFNIQAQTKVKYFDYDTLWKKIIKEASVKTENNIFHGAYVSYDDSPRRGDKRSIIVQNSSPEKFKLYFKKLYDISLKQNKEYIFLTAWNEWGEGAYIEPDTTNQNKYLTAIKNIVTGE